MASQPSQKSDFKIRLTNALNELEPKISKQTYYKYKSHVRALKSYLGGSKNFSEKVTHLSTEEMVNFIHSLTTVCYATKRNYLRNIKRMLPLMYKEEAPSLFYWPGIESILDKAEAERKDSLKRKRDDDDEGIDKDAPPMKKQKVSNVDHVVSLECSDMDVEPEKKQKESGDKVCVDSSDFKTRLTNALNELKPLVHENDYTNLKRYIDKFYSHLGEDPETFRNRATQLSTEEMVNFIHSLNVTYPTKVSYLRGIKRVLLLMYKEEADAFRWSGAVGLLEVREVNMSNERLKRKRDEVCGDVDEPPKKKRKVSGDGVDGGESVEKVSDVVGLSKRKNVDDGGESFKKKVSGDVVDGGESVNKLSDIDGGVGPNKKKKKKKRKVSVESSKKKKKKKRKVSVESSKKKKKRKGSVESSKKKKRKGSVESSKKKKLSDIDSIVESSKRKTHKVSGNVVDSGESSKTNVSRGIDSPKRNGISDNIASENDKKQKVSNDIISVASPNGKENTDSDKLNAGSKADMLKKKRRMDRYVADFNNRLDFALQKLALTTDHKTLAKYKKYTLLLYKRFNDETISFKQTIMHLPTLDIIAFMNSFTTKTQSKKKLYLEYIQTMIHSMYESIDTTSMWKHADTFLDKSVKEGLGIDYKLRLQAAMDQMKLKYPSTALGYINYFQQFVSFLVGENTAAFKHKILDMDADTIVKFLISKEIDYTLSQIYVKAIGSMCTFMYTDTEKLFVWDDVRNLYCKQIKAPTEVCDNKAVALPKVLPGEDENRNKSGSNKRAPTEACDNKIAPKKSYDNKAVDLPNVLPGDDENWNKSGTNKIVPTKACDNKVVALPKVLPGEHKNKHKSIEPGQNANAARNSIKLKTTKVRDNKVLPFNTTGVDTKSFPREHRNTDKAISYNLLPALPCATKVVTLTKVLPGESENRNKSNKIAPTITCDNKAHPVENENKYISIKPVGQNTNIAYTGMQVKTTKVYDSKGEHKNMDKAKSYNILPALPCASKVVGLPNVLLGEHDHKHKSIKPESRNINAAYNGFKLNATNACDNKVVASIYRPLPGEHENNHRYVKPDGRNINAAYNGIKLKETNVCDNKVASIYRPLPGEHENKHRSIKPDSQNINAAYNGIKLKAKNVCDNKVLSHYTHTINNAVRFPFKNQLNENASNGTADGSISSTLKREHRSIKPADLNTNSAHDITKVVHAHYNLADTNIVSIPYRSV